MSLKIPDPNQPSQKQLDFLDKLGYIGKKDITANEAAELIDELVEFRRQEEADMGGGLDDDIKYGN